MSNIKNTLCIVACLAKGFFFMVGAVLSVPFAFINPIGWNSGIDDFAINLINELKELGAIDDDEADEFKKDITRGL